MSSKAKKICMIISVLLAVLSIAIASLLYTEASIQIYIPILFTLLAVALGFIAVMSLYNRKESLFKTAVICLFFLAVALAIYVALLKTGVIMMLQEANNISEFIEKAGIWGPVVFMLIQFAQVTLIPIPSTITTIAGFVAFNNVGLVTVYSSIGMITGSMFAFFLGRTFGVKLVVWIVGAKSFNKYQKILHGRDKMMLFLMFLLPIFPDDLLCLFAGITTMSYGTFFLMQIIARPIGVAVSSFSLDILSMIPFKGWFILLWIAIVIGLIVMMVCVWKYSGRLEDAMVSFIVKHFGTKELPLTIDRAVLKQETQNLISDTLVDTDSELESRILGHTTQRYKARKYYISYK